MLKPYWNRMQFPAATLISLSAMEHSSLTIYTSLQLDDPEEKSIATAGAVSDAGNRTDGQDQVAIRLEVRIPSVARRAFNRLSVLLVMILGVTFILPSGLVSSIFTLVDLDGISPAVIETNTFAHATSVLQNGRVIMIGDSIMRYKYITLVHYLHTGTTISNYTNSTSPDSQNPINEKTWGSWTKFYEAPWLDGKETCDCFRSEDTSLDEVIENRHYIDPEKGFDISYFQYFTDSPPCTFRGRANVAPGSRYSDLGVDWCYTINGFLSYIEEVRTSDIVFFNTGLHSPLSSQTADSLLRFIPRTLNFIWFTTTPRLSQSKPPSQTTDKAITSHLEPEQVMDSWKLSVEFHDKYGAGIYWDDVHFQGWVYEEMLRKAIEQICKQEERKVVEVMKRRVEHILG